MLPPLLNIDLGELPDEPPELAALAGWANIACGGHAGDPESMRRTILRVRGRIAAHPSYPDHAGFGRTSMPLPAEALRETVATQCAALVAAAAAHGRRVVGVKPHGALYHDADRDPRIAEAVIAGALDALGPGIAVLGPARGALSDAARAAGLVAWREAFADRGMDTDGRLLPRGARGALLTEPAAAAAQAATLLETGAVDTLCVHGDTPGAIVIARAVAEVIERFTRNEPMPPGVTGAPGWSPGDRPEQPGRLHILPTHYGGPDLGEVSRRLGMTPEALVHHHAAVTWEVQLLGFLPGFAYLESPEWTWSVPRRDAPRPRVPAGSVALAGRRCGVYPLASPGGWQLIGQHDSALFDLVNGARLSTGDRVRFVALP